MSAFLVARAREMEYDPDDPPTRETPLDLATALRSVSASHLGLRRPFDDDPRPPMPTVPVDLPTRPSLLTPSSIRVQEMAMPVPLVQPVVPEPPVPSMAAHIARGLVIGVAWAVTITAGFVAWRIGELLLSRM